MKRIIFYEDIEDIELVNIEPEVREIRNWYKKIANQERNYYYDNRQWFDKSDDQQGVIGWSSTPITNLGNDNDFDAVLRGVNKWGYELRHKKEGDRSEAPYFRLIRCTHKSKPGEVIYICFDLSPGELVKSQRTDELRTENSDTARKILFYEDIEEVSVSEAEELLVWYEKLAKKRTEIEYIESLKSFSLFDMILKYEAWLVKEQSFEKIEDELTKREYEFRHKEASDQTEQLESSLLKVVDKGEVLYYLFVYITPLVLDREVNRRFSKGETD